MKKILSLFVLSMCCSLAMGQNFTVDSGHTSITTNVVRFGVVSVVGRFNNVSGTISYNSSDLSKTTGSVIIKTDSYTANNPDGEIAVKSVGFLDVANFPEIKFSVVRLEKSSTGTIAYGSLSLHGVVKNINFPVAIVGPTLDLPTNKQSIGVSGKVTINRQDYGIAFTRKLPNGTPIVSDTVDIEINLLAINK